jgi:hypothetical protein
VSTPVLEWAAGTAQRAIAAELVAFAVTVGVIAGLRAVRRTVANVEATVPNVERVAGVEVEEEGRLVAVGETEEQ